MNEIVNKFLLVSDKLMPEYNITYKLMHYQDLLIVPVDHLLKIKKEFKNLKNQEILVIFTRMH